MTSNEGKELEELDVIKSIRFNEIKQRDKCTLKDVYAVYDKWLEFKDKGRIDIALAVALTRKLKGTPIWLIFVGPSGDGKSQQLVSFLDDDKDTILLNEMTPNTLVSGMSSKKGENDLAPKLKDKLVVISDMAPLLNLNPNDKARIWAQLRELYDGRAGKITGTSHAKYDGIRVTMIAGSTPSIDGQILIFNHLGTRELLYRTNEDNHKRVIEKVMLNEEKEEQMTKELNEVTKNFIKYTRIDNIEISEKIKNRIWKLLDYMRVIRANAEVDSYTGELRNIVYPEQPTRCFKQFIRIFRALKSLEEGYDDERALGILKHIVISSSNPMRVLVLQAIKKCDAYVSAHRVSQMASVGKKTAIRELNILWNLGLVDRSYDEMLEEYKIFFTWKVSNRGKALQL